MPWLSNTFLQALLSFEVIGAQSEVQIHAERILASP
jgi:hypothetical protein